MNAYKIYITIEDPNNVVLSKLPFQREQRVEVIILAEDNERSTMSQKMEYLFERTHSLPGLEEITEEDIAAEIEAYRRSE